MPEEVVEIKNEDRLLRRAIFTDPSYVKDDMTVTSFAFKLRKGEEGLSVDLEKLTTYPKSIGDVEKYRLFAVIAGDVRSLGLDCFHKPVEGNYAHSEIVGNNSNSVRSQLAKTAIYIHYPQ
jgi:hypothetical protein